MNDRLLSLLGLARRAGKLSMGFDASCESAAKGEAALVLTTADISEGSLRRLISGVGGKAEIITLDCDMQQLAAAIGKSVRMVSVNDEGFAKKLRLLLTEADGAG